MKVVFALVLSFACLALAGIQAQVRFGSLKNTRNFVSSAPLSRLLTRGSFDSSFTTTTPSSTTCDWWNWFNTLVFDPPSIVEQVAQAQNCTNAYQSATGYTYFAGDLAGFGLPQLNVPDRTCTNPIPKGAKILIPILNGGWWSQDCCADYTSIGGPVPPVGCPSSYTCTGSDNLALAEGLNNYFGPPGNSMLTTNFSVSLQYGNDAPIYPSYERLSFQPCTVNNANAKGATYTNAGVDGYWVTLDTSKMPHDQPYKVRIQGVFADFGASFDIKYNFVLAEEIYAE